MASVTSVFKLRAWVALSALFLPACGGEPHEPDSIADLGQAATAPSWMLDFENHGTWTDPEQPDVVHVWIDAKVANVRYHKRLLIEVAAPYGDTWMRTLHVGAYRGGLHGGLERWGADTIEVYPDGGPFGTALTGPVVARLRFQHDLDGDGNDEMVTTAWQAIYGDGAAVAPADSTWDPGLTSPVSAEDEGPEHAIFWSPYDDPGQEVEARINALIAAKRAEPDRRVTLHAAVFNITDPGIVDRLIEAHRAGVEVRLLFDGRKFRPWYGWYDGDDRLLSAGVPLMGVMRSQGAMHDKIALFDGRTAATGSFNWEYGARFENHEAMLVTRQPELVQAYARRFEALAGGVMLPRAFANDPTSPASVSFAPDEEPHRIVGRLIDDARESIHVAMFTAKDVVYEENGRSTSLLQKLIAAQHRGVHVIAIVDHGIHEASEYHGIVSDDDQTDEWLESEGVKVVRADNQNGPYASMHHKFLSIDGTVAVLGAFNWYHDAAFHNDEDQVVLRDADVASNLDAEFVDMLRRYDSSFDPEAWPQVTLSFDAFCNRTSWGETLRVVGDDPSLGSWSPAEGLPLDASAWPRWSGNVSVPRGARIELKLVITGPAESKWESGRNRHVRATGESTVAVPMSFR